MALMHLPSCQHFTLQRFLTFSELAYMKNFSSETDSFPLQECPQSVYILCQYKTNRQQPSAAVSSISLQTSRHRSLDSFVYWG